MSDADFESVLGSQLRQYAQGGVRPIDRHAIARSTIATAPASGWRRLAWPRIAPARIRTLVFLALVGALLLAALLALGIGRPPAPTFDSGYQAILLRANPNAPETDIDVVAVGPNGEERLVRHLAASILPEGRRFFEFGEISQDRWLAVHTEIGSDDRSAAFALFDLDDPGRAFRLVPYQPVIGGAWGPRGLFATVAVSTDSGWTVTIVDADNGATTTLNDMDLPGGGPDLVWAADGSGLLVRDGSGGFAIRPVDGGPPVPGIPPLAPGPQRRIYAPDGSTLDICPSGEGCPSDPGGAAVTLSATQEPTRWYAGELGAARLVDGSFASNGRSIWLLLDQVDGARRVAMVARADAPGEWRVVGKADLGSYRGMIWIRGIAADDSTLSIGRDSGTDELAPFAMIRLDGWAASDHGGNLLGFVRPR